MFFWRTQKKKKGAGIDFKFMPPTNSQQTLIFAVAADPLQQERYTAAAGPTGHNEELDYYQRGGAGMEGKKKMKARVGIFFHFVIELKLASRHWRLPQNRKSRYQTNKQVLVSV